MDASTANPMETFVRKPATRAVPLAEFGINTNNTFQGFEKGPFTPESSGKYVFREDLLFLGLSWLDGLGPKGKNLSLYGPQGAGKTSLIFELAAKSGHEVFHISGADSAEGASLLGKITLRQGTMHLDPGPLLLAALRGGILLVDEQDLLPPGESAMLNIVLDGRPIPVPDGMGVDKYITPEPGFRIAVTSNTGGIGDIDMNYAGARRQHGGFLDRFRKARVGYLDGKQELELLQKIAPSISGTIAKAMVETAVEVRRQFEAGELRVTISSRSLHQWALDYIRFEGSSMPDVLVTTLDWSLPICMPEDHDGVKKVLDLKRP